MLDSQGRRNNRKLADKLCRKCGATFRPKRESAAYCSKSCARTKPGALQTNLETWWVNPRGYVEGRVLTAQGRRQVKQHRFYMECSLGRLLMPGEDVHHINGDKLDNRLSNLQLLSHSEHASISNFGRHSKARGDLVNPYEGGRDG